MIKTKYTNGFEKFWKTWTGITGKQADKAEAFRYWKRDKLEGDENELIRILLLQAEERKQIRAKNIWQPNWCFCRKWLNNRRYEYIPEQKIIQVENYEEDHKKKIRDDYQEYLEGKSTQALKDLKRDNGYMSGLCGWLIDEILHQRQGK